MPDPNQEKFNQLAKKALLELGEKPDYQNLYCLQLARVCLQKGLLECLNDQLSLNVHNLDDWNPPNAWAYLLGEEKDDPVLYLKEENPKP